MLDAVEACSGRLLVAVSGGVDSVSLLHALHECSKTIGVAHVNHNLRETSDLDQDFVRDLAKKYQAPFFSYSLQNPPDSNIEAWGREKRYKFFEEIRVEHKYDFILTAHHLQDNIETYLIKLITAKEPKGISVHPHILRPLINIDKSEILEYAQKNSLAWIDDYTNHDLRFLRNRVRHEILPVLKNVVPNIADILQTQIRRTEDLERFFIQIIDRISVQLSDYEFGDRNWYRELKKILENEPEELGIRLLQVVFLPKLQYRLSADSAGLLRDFFILERQGIELSGNFTIRRYNSGITLLKK